MNFRPWSLSNLNLVDYISLRCCPLQCCKLNASSAPVREVLMRGQKNTLPSHRTRPMHNHVRDVYQLRRPGSPGLLRCGPGWFRVQGSGFRVQGSGFRVQSSGFRVHGGRGVPGCGSATRRRGGAPSLRQTEKKSPGESRNKTATNNNQTKPNQTEILLVVNFRFSQQ